MSIVNHKQLILACHITGVFDVNRAGTLPDDDFSLVAKWASSLTVLQLPGIIFHNNFSAATIKKFSSPFIHFQKIEFNPVYNPNVYRYFIYQHFLKKNAHTIESLFLTDSNDVEVITNPFVQDLFIENPTALFCGDEPVELENEWMIAHSTQFRTKVPGYAEYEEKYAHAQLLNCGIIGGHLPVITALLDQLVMFHQQYNQHNKTAFTGDMGAFNYVVRNWLSGPLFHGAPVNTLFKGYKVENNSCWFRHK